MGHIQICNLYPCMQHITISLGVWAVTPLFTSVWSHVCLVHSPSTHAAFHHLQYVCLCVSTGFIWGFVYKFADCMAYVPRSLHGCSPQWYSGLHIPSLLSGMHWTLNVSLARIMYIASYITVSCSAHANVWRESDMHVVVCYTPIFVYLDSFRKRVLAEVLWFHTALEPGMGRIIGMSLSKPHTSVTALVDACVYVCLHTYVWPYTENFNWANRFQICTHAKTNSCSMN